MARARNIKPGFFKNEDLAECSPWARLCFAGLWTLADREGRLEDRPKRIKSELFAYDNVDVDALLDELVKHGFILRYQAEAIAAIQILEFNKHQTPHYSEKRSFIKAPTFREDSGKFAAIKPSSLLDDSGDLQDHCGQSPAMKRASQPPDSPNPSSPNPSSPNPSSLNPESLSARSSSTPGEICKAMRAAGMADANPSSPKLLALVAQGLTFDELTNAARHAVDRGKGFAWALERAAGQRADAARVALAPPQARSKHAGNARFVSEDESEDSHVAHAQARH